MAQSENCGRGWVARSAVFLCVWSASLYGAQVAWIGGSEGEWQEAANWSGIALPAAGDDVVVDTGSPVVVTHRDDLTLIRSLILNGTLALESGSLTIIAPSQINGELSLKPGAALTAQGSGASLDVNGSADLGGGDLIALDGARVTLPPATTYAGSGLLRAQGTDSRLELSALSSIFPSSEPFLPQDAVSRAVGVLNGLADDSIASVYLETVSRAVGVYNDPQALESPNPLDHMGSAVSRAVGVYNDPLANQSTDPLDLIDTATSRAVGVFNHPLANQSTDPLDLIHGAESRAVGVYNDPQASSVQDPAQVIKNAVSRSVGVQNEEPPEAEP